MKRVFFILLAIFAFESLASGQKTVYAPQQLIDVVYKVDGTTLRGTIVEQTPNVDYTLLTLDGHTIKIDALQIEKIVKEPLATATIVTENHNYNYNPYIVCKFDEDGNPIFPLDSRSAFFRSLIIPGLGQMYNGQTLKGAALLGGCVAGVLGVTWGTSLANTAMGEDIIGITSLAVGVGCYLYSLIDAPLYAKRWNKQHGFRFNGNGFVSVAPVVVVGRNIDGLGVGVSVGF